MGMAISTNGIYGPWQHIKEPIFSKDGGHRMYFEFKEKQYISLHHPNMPFLSEGPHFFEVVEKDNKLEIK